MPPFNQFKALFDEYFDRLYLYANRFLRDDKAATDCLYDVFLRLRDSHTIEGDVKDYLYSATRNACLDRLRHLQMVRSAQSEGENEAETSELSPDGEPEETIGLQEREASAGIQKAMDSLHPLEKEAVRLCWSEHLPVREAAERMGILPKTYAAHLRRAREHLRRTLGPIFDPEMEVRAEEGNATPQTSRRPSLVPQQEQPSARRPTQLVRGSSISSPSGAAAPSLAPTD